MGIEAWTLIVPKIPVQVTIEFCRCRGPLDQRLIRAKMRLIPSNTDRFASLFTEDSTTRRV